MASRESTRVKDANSRKILDDATRKRRARKALEALEQDNFHEDPHANLVMNKKIPKFEETLEGKVKRGRKQRTAEYYKQRFRKTFSQLVEEDQILSSGKPNYTSALAPPSKFPDRHYCAVCGFPSSYTCLTCGTRYCCIRCLETHQDTSCLN
nr:EOG090X0GXS [Artemia franciscana]